MLYFLVHGITKGYHGKRKGCRLRKIPDVGRKTHMEKVAPGRHKKCPENRGRSTPSRHTRHFEGVDSAQQPQRYGDQRIRRTLSEKHAKGQQQNGGNRREADEVSAVVLRDFQIGIRPAQVQMALQPAAGLEGIGVVDRALKRASADHDPNQRVDRQEHKKQYKRLPAFSLPLHSAHLFQHSLPLSPMKRPPGTASTGRSRSHQQFKDILFLRVEVALVQPRSDLFHQLGLDMRIGHRLREFVK